MATGRTTPSPRPTAGALRFVEASTTTPTTIDITTYVRQQMTAHCLCLPPSLRPRWAGSW
ncbi:hypothetical protein ABZ924_31500 [Streptomyces sp. NPDC046876]|uniref:hypothetical protein n=1 Tax=Streptomyces sp. NPDC046876 TaxID=3155616 RepID=UPI00340A7964